MKQRSRTGCLQLFELANRIRLPFDQFYRSVDMDPVLLLENFVEVLVSIGPIPKDCPAIKLRQSFPNHIEVMFGCLCQAEKLGEWQCPRLAEGGDLVQLCPIVAEAFYRNSSSCRLVPGPPCQTFCHYRK